MGTRKNSILIFFIAVVLLVTSTAGSFAAVGADSDTHGKTTISTKGHIRKNSKSYIEVKETIKKASKGKINKARNKVTNLKEGQLVVIVADNGAKAYRWIKSVKITQAKNKTVKWKKVKGAKYYMVRVTGKNGKVRTYYTKSNKWKRGITKGSKVNVRPVKKKNGNNYVGVYCKTKKVR